jgi:hypothetical protein
MALTRPVVPPDGSFIFSPPSPFEPRSVKANAKESPGDYGLRAKVVVLAGQVKSFPQNNVVTRF